MTTREDRELEAFELEALLREQTLLPLPLALVGRILDELLPVERVSPWVLVGRAAAAVLVFCASWLALSGDVPAFADVAPEQHVEAALRAAVLPADLPLAAASPRVLDAAGGDALVWLAGGALVLLAGVVSAWRAHGRAQRGGGGA